MPTVKVSELLTRPAGSSGMICFTMYIKKSDTSLAILTLKNQWS